MPESATKTEIWFTFSSLLATTCTDLEYDPFKTIKITLPQNDTANDINVTLTDNNGVIVLTADSANLSGNLNKNFIEVVVAQCFV